MKKEIAASDFILEQDLDKLLWECENFREKHTNGQVIFHRLLPFDNLTF
jgi:hypothetical protein